MNYSSLSFLIITPIQNKKCSTFTAVILVFAYHNSCVGYSCKNKGNGNDKYGVKPTGDY